MSLTSEVELVQNNALGALSLWAFTKEFSKRKRWKSGPPFPLASIVLPMVFHEETLEAIYSRRFEGGFFTALAQHRDLGLELQERSEAMLPQTMGSLNFCFAAGILTFDKQTAHLLTIRRTAPFQLSHAAPRRILSGAERLGYWFATINTSRLCSLLQVRF